MFNNADLTDCLFGETGAIQRILFGPIENRIMYTISSGRLKVFDIALNSVVNECKAHDNNIICCELSKDKIFIATGGIDNNGKGQLRLWRAYNLRLEKDIITIDNGVSAIAFSQNKEYLIAGDRGGKIYLFKFPEMQLINKKHRHTGSIISLQISNEGRILFSAGEDNHIWAWSVPHLNHIDVWKKCTSPQKIILSDNILICSPSNTTKQTSWDISHLIIKNKRFNKTEYYKGSIGYILTIRNKGKKHLIYIYNERLNRIEIIDTQNRDNDIYIPNITKKIQALDVNEDGTKIAIGDIHGSINIIDIQTKTITTEISTKFSGMGMSIKNTRGLTSSALNFLLSNGAKI